MYTNLELGLDSRAWLRHIAASSEFKTSNLPLEHDALVDEMPDDTERLKRLISEMQFENDLLRGVNQALQKHILMHREWRKTGLCARLTDPLDIMLED